MAESEEALRGFLMKVKEESEKAGLKLNIQKTKIMASGPITSWQIGNNGNSEKLYFLGLQNHCSHEMKRCSLLGRKAMSNLDRMLKSGDITLPTKVRLVKSYGFSSSRVWMWELDHQESWAPKKRCFWTVVLEETLESPLGLQGDPTSPS